jgi:hypothetical protein
MVSGAIALGDATILALEVLHTEGHPHTEVDVNGAAKIETVAPYRTSAESLTPDRAGELTVLVRLSDSPTGPRFELS